MKEAAHSPRAQEALKRGVRRSKLHTNVVCAAVAWYDLGAGFQRDSKAHQEATAKLREAVVALVSTR